MNEELKAMLESLTTEELNEVRTVVQDLIDIKEEDSDDGQPDEMKENQDFAKDDEIPYEPGYDE